MSVFHARILASDALFFDGDCEFMVVPCTDGAMGILSHHSNMIAAVVPGELRFQPLRGFAAIVDGEMDQYPEAAFYNVGTLDDVVAKAKKIEEGEV